MRHQVAGKHLSRTSSHRKALRRNLAASLFEHGTIVTTIQKAKFVSKRAALAKEIKAPVLRKYDMLRTRRNGKAVVGVINGVCQGCFMSIPPQQFNDIMKGDRILNCPTCQRILYHMPEKEEG